MNPKKLIAALLILLLLIPQAPMPVAFAAEGYGKVQCQTFPGTGGRDLPAVGQDYSAFSCNCITDGVTVTGWMMTDGSGNSCSGIVQNKAYTLSIFLKSENADRVFTWVMAATINGVEANVSAVSDDGYNATITREIMPRLVAPTIWHSPDDESHNAGELFSFTASASPTYTSFQWFLVSPSGQEHPAESVTTLFPGTVYDIADLGRGGGCRCNLFNVPAGLDGWSIYCVFKVEWSETKTGMAQIHVINAAPPTPEPTPKPTPVPTPVLTPEPTPEPLPDPTPSQEELPEGLYLGAEDWSSVWSFDEDYHWHKSMNLKSDAVSDKGTHDMVWSETVRPTKKADGEETGICSVCGYTTHRPVIYTRSSSGPDLLLWGILGIAGLLLVSIVVIFVQLITSRNRRRRRRRKRR